MKKYQTFYLKIFIFFFFFFLVKILEYLGRLVFVMPILGEKSVLIENKKKQKYN